MKMITCPRCGSEFPKGKGVEGLCTQRCKDLSIITQTSFHILKGRLKEKVGECAQPTEGDSWNDLF